MESLFVDEDAARVVAERPSHVSEAVALRTYTARLLGKEQALVLHGGGNTSVKATVTTPFGEKVDVLHVKGSGWDLATIEPPGHPAVRMTHLLRMLEQPSMTDEQMVNELRLALLDASAPTPSVEALLHAALPAKYIDHTHADAVLAVADQKEARRICEEIWKDQLLFVPYVMPGFGLAKVCKRAWDEAVAEGRRPTVMVLERHGIFTLGETAKESYTRMIDAVTAAERYAADAMSTANVPAIERNQELEAIVMPIVRGALARVSNEPMERGPIVVIRSNEWIIHFLHLKNARELVARGCATPDHVIRTKPEPLFVHGAVDFDEKGSLTTRLEREIIAYAQAYDAYFEETCKRRGITRTRLDPWPRVMLLPKIGILAFGKTKKEAEAVADVYEHTIQVIMDAEDVGAYAPVSRDDLFDVEYWSLEQAKIKKTADLPLARKVCVVTGAASGIAFSTMQHFLELGAHVVACDRDASGLEKAAAELSRFSSQLATRQADVTQTFDVDAVFRLAARTFGGVDIVVSNAGTAAEGRLDSDEGDAALKASLEINLLAHNVVAACAAETMRLANRGGCILFNASKSAFNPGPGFGPYAVAKAALVALMRQYAVDLGKNGIRANAVNADRIRTGIFEGGVLASRAAARGLTVDDYFRSNLLAREVTAFDVAQAFGYLAQAQGTTGCVITVDGGNAAAFPR